jgi:hypothetical protein
MLTLYYTESRMTGISYIKRMTANWIGHNWHRNCLLNHVIEGKIEGRIDVTG